MDIRQLRCFVRVAEAGSVSAAAESLFLTRSAVSKSLSQLENELGYRLRLRALGQDGGLRRLRDAAPDGRGAG